MFEPGKAAIYIILHIKAKLTNENKRVEVDRKTISVQMPFWSGRRKVSCTWSSSFLFSRVV